MVVCEPLEYNFPLGKLFVSLEKSLPMDYIVKVKLPDNLLNQAERAAASLGLSAEDYLRITLEEKVRRWADDEEDQQKIDALMQYIMDKRQEPFRRLAQWPEPDAQADISKSDEGE